MSDAVVEKRDAKSVQCPHCDKPLGFEIVARARAESKMTFKLAPGPGNFMTAKNIGGCIEAMGTLLKACGKDMGIPTEVLVERIETSDDGEISVHLLVARWADHQHSTESRKRRKKAAKASP